MKKFALGLFCSLGIATAYGAIGSGPGGQFILVTNTLQAGATFFVSSGTILNLRVSSITFLSDNSVQTRAAVSGGGSSSLQVQVNGVQISSPTSSLRFDSNFTGNQPSAGIANISLNPGSTLYIQNTNTLQSGSTFYVSSGTVQGQLIIRNGNQRVTILASTATLTQLVNVSSESAFIQIIGSNVNRWRIGSDAKHLNTETFDIYNETTTINDITISTADLITINGTILMANLTASRPLKLDANKQIVTGLIDITSDITGVLPTANLPSNIAYTNVSNTFSSSQTFTTIQFATATVTKAIIWPDGSIQVSSPSAGGGGGGGSPAGSNTQFQFNNSGSFGGSPDLTTNGSTVTSTNFLTTTMTVTGHALFQSMSTTTWKSVTSITLNDGALLDLSNINDSNTSEGLKLPQNTDCTNATAQGQTCWKTDSGQLYMGTGSGTTLIGPINFIPGSTDYIQNTGSLQTGATFYVSSGSVSGQLDISTMTVWKNLFMGPGTAAKPNIALKTVTGNGINIGGSLDLSVSGISIMNVGGSQVYAHKSTRTDDNDMLLTTNTVSQLLFSASGIDTNFYLRRAVALQKASGQVYEFTDGLRNKAGEHAYYFVGLFDPDTGNALNDVLHIDISSNSSTTGFVGINISTPLASLSVGGHIETSSTTINLVASSPTVSSCGTNPSVSGTDVSGKITIGGGVVTSCTLTFGKAWTNAPACTILSNTAITAPTGSTTTAIFTLGAGATFAGDVIMYNCLGYQ